MKKILLSVLAIFLCLFILGCEKTDEETVEPTDTKTGGWTISTDIKAATIPAEAKKAFDKAVAENDGMTFEPIALLGTQVVAGTNYMFLCKGTTVTQTPVTSLKVVIVYNDLKNNATISKVSDFNLEKYVSKDIAYPTDNVVGGWTPNKVVGDVQLPEDAKKAFDGIAITGATYTPVAVLGTQLVAGTNYAFLVVGETATKDPITTIDVLTVYKDLENKSSLTSVAYVDLAEFNK